jgi:hypothetical protein
MLAAMHGKIGCVLKLLQAGANVSEQTHRFLLLRISRAKSAH